MDSLWGTIRQGLSRTALSSNAPLALIVLFGGSLSYRSHAILRQDRDMVVHTYQVIGALHEALMGEDEAEAAQRGFVITGDTAFLAPYQKAKAQTEPAIAGDLDRLLVRNAGQRERFTRLRTAMDAKFRDMQDIIDVRRNQGFEAAQARIQNQADRRLSDNIHAIVSEMDSVEQKLLTERSQHVAASERRILLFGGITVALSVAIRLFLALRAEKQGE